MSVTREITVVCDICHRHCDSCGLTNADARESARDEGWRRRKIDGRWLDICYACLHPDEHEQAAAQHRREISRINRYRNETSNS